MPLKLRSLWIVLVLVSAQAFGQQSLQPQVVQPAETPAPPAAPAPSQPQAQPAVPAQTLPQPQPVPRPGSGSAQQNPLQQVLNAMVGPGGVATPPGRWKQYGDDPPENADWSRYSYPDNHRFYYGGYGVGNIGNGLCTSNNVNRTQVTRGYCALLADLLEREGTCANRYMRQILQILNSTGGTGIQDFQNYCSTFSRLTSGPQQTLVFQQILAGLITQESGWNPGAQERPWTRADGMQMGGKGLFQIGVRDRSQDADCADVNERTIFDPWTNMKCGVCIALKNVVRDRAMGHGTGDSGARGMARYFGPFRDAQVRKRAAIANATNQYCAANTGGNPSGSGMSAITTGSGRLAPGAGGTGQGNAVRGD